MVMHMRIKVSMSVEEDSKEKDEDEEEVLVEDVAISSVTTAEKQYTSCRIFRILPPPVTTVNILIM